jgi:adenosylcobinamide amidohydrolase
MKEKEITLKIKGVKVKIIYHTHKGSKANTLLVSFGEKHRVLSTLDGFREVSFVANTYVPYNLKEHNMKSYQEFVENFPKMLKIPPDEIAFLSTAVDMDNVAVCEESYEDLMVCCLATAGVRGNALRTGVDGASWVDKDGEFKSAIGTIIIILLTNVTLSDGAMARAIMTATEAKTAALQDLDVRSTVTPQNQATGTGTDNMIVASGKGLKSIQIIGGHTKMGELIGVSTKKAVTEAIKKRKY